MNEEESRDPQQSLKRVSVLTLLNKSSFSLKELLSWPARETRWDAGAQAAEVLDKVIQLLQSASPLIGCMHAYAYMRGGVKRLKRPTRIKTFDQSSFDLVIIEIMTNTNKLRNTKTFREYPERVILETFCIWDIWSAELHNVNFFTQIKIWVKNLPQKRVNWDWFVFATKCVKIWFVCSCFNSYFFQLQIYINFRIFGLKSTPMKWISKYFTPYLYLG